MHTVYSEPGIDLRYFLVQTIRMCSLQLPVLGRAGQLTSFSMRYTADCPAMHCCCSGQCSRNKTILINDTDLNQRTSYMRVIDGLCPSTTYTVIVSAMNREQTSPISGSASGVTDVGSEYQHDLLTYWLSTGKAVLPTEYNVFAD